jgi:hypothetical protein
MSFATTFTDKALVLSDSDAIVFGTAMIGDTYGEVKSVSLKRTSDKVEVENSVGGLRALILKKRRFELQMECRFDSDVTAPGEMDLITFPFAAVVGRITEPEIKWDSGGVRMLSFTATQWDELTEAPLYSWSGTALTELDDGTIGEV